RGVQKTLSRGCKRALTKRQNGSPLAVNHFDYFALPDELWLSSKKVWSRQFYLSPSRNISAGILSFALYFITYFFTKKSKQKTCT
ncbi:MAG: hypothetical protein IKM65_08780, partial [Bacteroidaceae bacterium]|nr:hypothetical protein [Bacteroidaceae bacterium]